jgi:O-antigen/teichoic acid export membrane protein
VRFGGDIVQPRRSSQEISIQQLMPSPRKTLNLAGVLRDTTGHALGLMALRSMTIAAKFVLTLFIARYLGLAELGIFGIVTSAAVLAPVLLGFGVSNNLGREAARDGAAAITARLSQYFIVLLPIYATLCIVSVVIFPGKAVLLVALGLLLFLEHIQTDMFSLMMMTGRPYAANLVNFIRSAAWVVGYVPLALIDPRFRTLNALVLAWLAGCVVATILTVVFTSHWRWHEAVEALPASGMTLPHRHGSTALYLNDVANTLFQYVDRYIVGIFLSVEILGIYVLFWSIGNAMSNLITTAVVQTRKSTLVQVAYFSPQSFNRNLRDVAFVTGGTALGLSISAILAVHVAVPFLGRPQVIPYLPILYVLCVGLIFRTVYEVLGISFYAHGRDDITLYSGVLILISAITLNVALDPVFGIWGAGAALLASYAVGVTARAVVISRGFQRRVYANEPTQVQP